MLGGTCFDAQPLLAFDPDLRKSLVGQSALLAFAVNRQLEQRPETSEQNHETELLRRHLSQRGTLRHLRHGAALGFLPAPSRRKYPTMYH